MSSTVENLCSNTYSTYTDSVKFNHNRLFINHVFRWQKWCGICMSRFYELVFA